uniref:Morc S5 domain-containing protein n=1 Tax=Lotharella globosa TaxID=91324 RepID=A0A7S3YQA2_9EUKA
MPEQQSSNSNTDALGYIRTCKNYLRSASAVHHRTSSTAFAELVDNAKDASAKTVWINRVTARKNQFCLSITDDGVGLDDRGLLNMFGLGYSEGKLFKGGIGEYGAGFKSGSMKLGRDVLVLTIQKRSHRMFAGLLSRTMHDMEGLQDLTAVTVEIVEGEDGELAVKQDSRKHRQSIDMIKKYSGVVQSEKGLVTLMKRLREAKRSTRILISRISSDLEWEKEDICMKMPRDKHYRYERSLRVYLSHIYGKIRVRDQQKNPTIVLRNSEIIPVIWEKTLYHKGETSFAMRIESLRGLGRVQCLVGFKDPLNQYPGKPEKLKRRPENEPQGVIWLVNGRTVELFTPTKTQAGQNGDEKAWTKYSAVQAKGKGARIICELNLNNPTGLKLQQNKDGFQKNDSYYKLLAKMDEQLRKHCSQAMHKYIYLKCGARNCEHSNIGIPGGYYWNEPPIKKLYHKIKGPSQRERESFICPGCRNECPEIFKIDARKVMCTCTGEDDPCPHLLVKSKKSRVKEEPLTSADEDEDENMSALPAKSSEKGKKRDRVKPRKRKATSQSSSREKIKSRRTETSGSKTGSKRRRRRPSPVYEDEEREESPVKSSGDELGIRPTVNAHKTQTAHTPSGSSEDGESKGNDVGTAVDAGMKHMLSIGDGEKLESCGFEEADVGNDLYVPFEMIISDNDIRTDLYLGKVLAVRQADSGAKILKFSWANGDPDQEIEEAQLPRGKKMRRAGSKRQKRTIEQKTGGSVVKIGAEVCDGDFSGAVVRCEWIVESKDGVERRFTEAEIRELLRVQR